MILEILGSAGFGTALGGLFGYLGKREDNRALEIRHQHEENMLEKKTSAKVKLGELNLQQTVEAGRQEVQKIEATAFEKSQEVMSKFGAGVKAIVRPIITVYLLYMVHQLLTAINKINGVMETLTVEMQGDLARLVIIMLTSLTATAVAWWFASRPGKTFDRLVEKL